jgi:hypothetical protein
MREIIPNQRAGFLFHRVFHRTMARPELFICNVIFVQFVSDFSCLFFG